MLLAYIILAVLMLLCYFISWLKKTKDMKTAEKFCTFADISCIAMSSVGIFSIVFMFVVALFLR